MADSPLIYLVAAEASGDALGADLARALRARSARPLELAGVGGRRMAAAGVPSAFDISDLSVLGILDGLKAYPRVRRLARQAAEDAAARRPAAAVLIDSWGFNLRVAWALRELSPETTLVKYIGPQVWATRPGRAKTLAEAVDLLLTIHAFDAPYFESTGLETVFVGNPALHRSVELGDGAAFRARHGLGDAPVLAVLFGSRPSEIARLWAPFTEAARRLFAERPDLRIVTPVAETVERLIRERAAELPELVLVPQDERADLYAAANAAIACSGTATSELALAGVPTVVGYRADRLAAALFRLLGKTDYVSLVNIAAGEALMPELLQEACTPEALAAAAARYLDDPEAARAASARLRAAAHALKGEMDSPAEAAAEAVLRAAGIPLAQ